jgi:hypothetical protein
MGKLEVMKLMSELQAAWPGHCYDLLRRNCCHFCACNLLLLLPPCVSSV